MKDLIYRQAVIDALEGLLDSMLETDTIGFYEIRNALSELPSAQPEIIRCKDCKHRHEAECPMYHEEDIEWDDDGYIERETIYYDWTEDDGYCDRAERRTDEQIH